MIKNKSRLLFMKVILAGLVLLMIHNTSYADAKIVEKQSSEEGLTFISKIPNGHYMLRVTGPEGFLFEKISSGDPLSMVTFGPDGQYRYEVTALPDISSETKAKMRTAREANDRNVMKSFQKRSEKQSGYFRVQGGTILNSDIEEKRSSK